MKTSLSHLPEDKQEELQTITKIIVENVPAEMIILFGSHAHGDWVEDYQEHTEYVSDFDILVITGDRKSAKDGEIARKQHASGLFALQLYYTIL